MEGLVLVIGLEGLFNAVECGMGVMWRSACLFVSPLAVVGYDFLFGCRTVGQASGLGLGDGPGVGL